MGIGDATAAEGASGKREREAEGRRELRKGRGKRVLYKTARDITSNIRKTDSPAAASSRGQPPPARPSPLTPRPAPRSPPTVRRGNEVVSILASGRTYTPAGVYVHHQLLWHVNVQARGNDCARLTGRGGGGGEA